MDRISLFFCTLSLIVTLGLAALAYPYAALSTERMAAAGQIAEAEEIADIDLGDFGVVSVAEMLDYFIANPPPPPEAGAAGVRKVRFQGC